jgi:uncharacterized membrane protein HdeD (DUF308 family)
MELPVDRSIRHWWVFLIRGLLFILLGIYMIANPATSFVALGFVFGLVILIAGIVELFHVVREPSATNRGWHLFLGIVDIILGLVLMSHVAAGITILRLIVGIWFIFRGFSLFSFSRAMGNSWLLMLGGILTMIFGLLVIFNPVFGAMTIIIWIAIAFIITGFFNAMLGFRVRKIYP